MSDRDMLDRERQTMHLRKMRNAEWEQPKEGNMPFYVGTAFFVLVLFFAGLIGGLGDKLV